MRISNLSAGYGTNLVIKNFSLKINSGERYIIAGPNGSGKTTLLKCILGTLKPLEGKISLDTNENIAYCKQDFPNSPFPITVEEVVAMGIGKFQKSEMLKQVQHDGKHILRSKGKINHHNKLITSALQKADALHLKNRLFYSLSGGERQKVSLARCYCQNASLLLLDEPSSFLDSESKISFINQMTQLQNENFSILAVTHDEEIITELLKFGWKIVRSNEWS